MLIICERDDKFARIKWKSINSLKEIKTSGFYKLKEETLWHKLPWQINKEDLVILQGEFRKGFPFLGEFAKEEYSYFKKIVFEKIVCANDVGRSSRLKELLPLFSSQDILQIYKLCQKLNDT
jgi:hypothetical protein